MGSWGESRFSFWQSNCIAWILFGGCVSWVWYRQSANYDNDWCFSELLFHRSAFYFYYHEETMAYAALFSSIIFGLIHEFAGNHTSHAPISPLIGKLNRMFSMIHCLVPLSGFCNISMLTNWWLSRWLVEYGHPRSCIRVRRRIPCAGNLLSLWIWIFFLQI